MVVGLEMVLDYWQYYEELWLCGEVVVKLMIIEVLGMICQILVIFGGLVLCKVSIELCVVLIVLEFQLELKNVKVEFICYSVDYLKCKLVFILWLVIVGWWLFMDDKV